MPLLHGCWKIGEVWHEKWRCLIGFTKSKMLMRLPTKFIHFYGLCSPMIHDQRNIPNAVKRQNRVFPYSDMFLYPVCLMTVQKYSRMASVVCERLIDSQTELHERLGCGYSFISSISSSYNGVGLVLKADADPRHDHQQNAPWDCLFTLLIITSLHRQTREVLLFPGSYFLTRLYGCSLHSWACNHIPNPQRPRPMPAHPHESRPHFTNRIMHLMPWKQNHSGIRSRQESVGKIIE